jgi:hypothetical protein
MSYDLMVFDLGAAPPGREAFLDWYDGQTQWTEDHAYDDPAVATPALRAFYLDMLAAFPVGAERPGGDDDDELSGTDYTVGKSLIYMSFAWDQVDQAHEAVFRLAARHGLGFFDVSSDLAETWVADGKGGLRIAHSD